MKTKNSMTMTKLVNQAVKPAAVAAMALLLLGATPRTFAADQENMLPTICVGRTEDSSGLQYWQPAIGEGLAHIMTTELGKMKDKFVVLERRDLDKLRDERELGDSGEVSMKERVNKGEWLGADYTFIIKVTRFGNSKKETGASARNIKQFLPRIPGLPVNNLDFKFSKDEYEVQFDWRVVDNASSRIRETGSATGTQKDNKFNISSWEKGGFSEESFRDGNSAIGRACMTAVTQIVADVRSKDFPSGARTTNRKTQDDIAEKTIRSVIGTVLTVDGNEVWMSVGAENHFRPGDNVKIYEPVHKRNSKGNVVATDFKLAAQVTLKKSQSNRSIGIVDQDIIIKEGWAVVHGTTDIDQLAGEQSAWLDNQKPKDAPAPQKEAKASSPPKESDEPQIQRVTASIGGSSLDRTPSYFTPIVGCLAGATALAVGVIVWKVRKMRKQLAPIAG